MKFTHHPRENPETWVFDPTRVYPQGERARSFQKPRRDMAEKSWRFHCNQCTFKSNLAGIMDSHQYATKHTWSDALDDGLGESEPDLPDQSDPSGRDGDQKPAVTREQYDQARAVLDALPPGFYTKCGGCGGWHIGGKYKAKDGNSKVPLCERCW